MPITSLPFVNNENMLGLLTLAKSAFKSTDSLLTCSTTTFRRSKWYSKYNANDGAYWGEIKNQMTESRRVNRKKKNRWVQSQKEKERLETSQKQNSLPSQ
eukprot:TRINITY_DN3288_c0_g1_i1.p1 TRINITY_DN3288_c0_g1~~TRINITY_DN3288_c0_g1_i1.p1  ORF type:complete len:100 (-),score=12.17 TRINITY_DN3288_c0_g1_i1:90-389(-)